MTKNYTIVTTNVEIQKYPDRTIFYYLVYKSKFFGFIWEPVYSVCGDVDKAYKLCEEFILKNNGEHVDFPNTHTYYMKSESDDLKEHIIF